MPAKTYSTKAKDIKRQWYVIDAGAASLGRVATAVATHLMGKHKPSYDAHIDMGDGVIVINAAKLQLTGSKWQQKTYYRHSGHPGALKQASAAEVMAKDPTQLVISAVTGMLPKNKLQAPRLLRLKVYKDDKHGQEAQKPITIGADDGDK